MNATRKVKLRDINPFLACNLCKGYMIDATTTIECLHSFCKSCIVKHLENSEYCPVCEVQLHSTKPLSGIRSDQMLQEIIFKLVPGLFQSEMEKRRNFYKEHLNSTPISQLDSGRIFNQPYITSDDKINISLEYFTKDKNIQESSKRYFHCPAEVSVSVLKKLVQGKHELANDAHIDIMYGERILPDDFLLMDIAYKYSWTDSTTKPLELRYRLKDVPHYNLQTPKLTKRFAAKRKSRSLTDSEVLKLSNVNSQVVTPKLTPNGKVRGRKKRSLISDEQSPIVETKKKRLSKTPKNFKEMESQSDQSHLVSSYPVSGLQNEVQLQISENGVISAQTIVFESKLADSSQITQASETTSHVAELLKPQNLITLNVPNLTTRTEVALPTTSTSNGMNSKTNGISKRKIGDCTRVIIKKGKTVKRKIVPADFKNVPMGIRTETEDSFANMRGNIQKALHDLQQKQFHTPSEVSTSISNSLVKHPVTEEKQSNSNYSSKIVNGLGLNSKIPLPFPLASWELSGMSVNLIPSSDLKSNKGKSSPSATKKQKHQTTIVNGDLKFTTSSRQILPSPVKAVNGVISPKKPPKFFKSRQSSATDGDSPVKSDKLTSQPTTLYSNGTSNGMLCLSPNATDLKLINSTSSKKSSTTTTTSLMTTPSTNSTQNCPSALSGYQLMHCYNQLFPMPFAPINYKPFVTNDYISMPFCNPRTMNNSTLPSMSNLSYPMVYPTTPNLSYALTGFTQHQANYRPEFSNGTCPTSVPADLSISKKSSNKNKAGPKDSTSLDLTMRNGNKALDMLSKSSPIKTPISPSSQEATKTLSTDSGNSFKIFDTPFESREESNNDKTKDDELTTSISNGHIEVSDPVPLKNGATEETANNEGNCSTHNQDLPVSSPLTSQVLPCHENGEQSENHETIKPELENGLSLPANSYDNDSTDLVINEDVISLPTPSPIPQIENGNNPEFSLNNNAEKSTKEPNEHNLVEGPIVNGHHDQKDQLMDSNTKELQENSKIKSSPICNNNNENDPPAVVDSSLSLSQSKLPESASSTTGA